MLEFELRTKTKEGLALVLEVYLKEMSAVEDDTHVSMQTLNFKQRYTGERIREGESLENLKKNLDACAKRRDFSIGSGPFCPRPWHGPLCLFLEPVSTKSRLLRDRSRSALLAAGC